jgi:hypothetical protein
MKPFDKRIQRLLFLPAPSGVAADCDVIDLKVMMQLGAFNVLVCDQSCSMAHIKIQGTTAHTAFQLRPST